MFVSLKIFNKLSIQLRSNCNKLSKTTDKYLANCKVGLETRLQI